MLFLAKTNKQTNKQTNKLSSFGWLIETAGYTGFCTLLGNFEPVFLHFQMFFFFLKEESPFSSVDAFCHNSLEFSFVILSRHLSCHFYLCVFLEHVHCLRLLVARET